MKPTRAIRSSGSMRPARYAGRMRNLTTLLGDA
jgi:hypothetical protein